MSDLSHLRLHAVNIFVTDQERSLRFYLDQLGFQLAFDARSQTGERWVAVAPPDGTAVLSLVAPAPDSKEYALIGRPTDVVFVTDDVPARYVEWSKRGVRFRFSPRLRRVKYGEVSKERVWGGVFTRFEDPDRNSFALISLDEVNEALEIQRRETAQKLEVERRAAQELQIAKQVQAGLFPQRLPALPALEYAGICIQARQVGGDYYDFLDLGNHRLGLVIGDIAGKGIAAALLMSNLQANLRSQCAIAHDQPGAFLQSVNRLFFENTIDSAYATLFFGEYDDETGGLRYANCGHLSALLLREDNTLEYLASTSTVVGLFEEWECAIGACQLRPGDTLALYTDGVTESVSHAGEEFGERRLVEALRRHRALAPEAMIQTVVDEIKDFSPHEQHDDITLVIGRRRG